MGWLLHRHVVALPLPLSATAGLRLGALVVAAGLALAAWGALTFRAARTGILPHRPAVAIVTAGPYRFTRNPMYVGMAIAQAGTGVVLHSWWPLLTLAVVIPPLVHFVIALEERYLDAAFPVEYRAYRARVRRWF